MSVQIFDGLLEATRLGSIKGRISRIVGKFFECVVERLLGSHHQFKSAAGGRYSILLPSLTLYNNPVWDGVAGRDGFGGCHDR